MFGKKFKLPKLKSPLKAAKQKVRKEARKSVKKATGSGGGGLFDWLFGKRVD